MATEGSVKGYCPGHIRPTNKGTELVRLPRAVQSQNKTGLGNTTYGSSGSGKSPPPKKK